MLVAAGGDDGGGGGAGVERKLKTFLQTDLMFMFVLSSISPEERRGHRQKGTEREWEGGREPEPLSPPRFSRLWPFLAAWQNGDNTR